MGSSRVKRGVQALWVPDRDLSCGCPALQMGRSFLLIGSEESGRSWVPEERRLVADRTTMALQWREHWSPKLRGFRGQDTRGKCPQGNTTAQKHSHPNSYEEYTPPHLDKLQSEPHRPHKHTHTAHEQYHLTTQSGGSDLTHAQGGTQDIHEKHTVTHLKEDRTDETVTPPFFQETQDTQDPLSGDSRTSQDNKHERYHPTACPTWSPGWNRETLWAGIYKRKLRNAWSGLWLRQMHGEGYFGCLFLIQSHSIQWIFARFAASISVFLYFVLHIHYITELFVKHAVIFMLFFFMSHALHLQSGKDESYPTIKRWKITMFYSLELFLNCRPHSIQCCTVIMK